MCRYCGKTWTATVETELPEPTEPADNGVIFRPVRCPDCGSAETRVTSTRKPIRHHKCIACGKAFKSCEE